MAGHRPAPLQACAEGLIPIVVCVWTFVGPALVAEAFRAERDNRDGTPTSGGPTVQKLRDVGIRLASAAPPRRWCAASRFSVSATASGRRGVCRRSSALRVRRPAAHRARIGAPSNVGKLNPARNWILRTIDYGRRYLNSEAGFFQRLVPPRVASQPAVD